jgi:DNA-binding NtrC family response regulator
VTAEAWAILERHSWPGNVRELRNAAQRLVVLDNDGRITAEDLDGALHHIVRPRENEEARWPSSYSEAQDKALRDFRAEYVRRLLELHDGNVSHAAVGAGVSRRTLHRWLAELNGAAPKEPPQ